MAAPRWQVLLAESSDLSNVADITTHASSKQLSLALNKPGSFSFNIPLFDDLAGELQPVSRCVKLKRNGVIVWSGMLWQLNESAPEDKINVSCVGWLELLNKRFTEEKVTYSTTNAGTIAHNLLAIANAQKATWITAGSNDSTQTRTYVYEKYSSIGQSLQELTTIENGFDMLVDPVTRELDIFAKLQTDRPGVLFGYDEPPDNLKSIQRTTDADLMQNRVIAAGKYGSYAYDDTTSQNAMNLFTAVQQLSEVASQEVLQAFAVAEIAVNAYPRQTFQFVPLPTNTVGRVVPQPFAEFSVGDKVYFRASRGRLQVPKQAVRVFTLNVSITDEGNEEITEMATTSNA